MHLVTIQFSILVSMGRVLWHVRPSFNTIVLCECFLSVATASWQAKDGHSRLAISGCFTARKSAKPSFELEQHEDGNWEDNYNSDFLLATLSIDQFTEICSLRHTVWRVTSVTIICKRVRNLENLAWKTAAFINPENGLRQVSWFNLAS